jgi:hypothetical protein
MASWARALIKFWLGSKGMPGKSADCVSEVWQFFFTIISSEAVSNFLFKQVFPPVAGAVPGDAWF